MFLFSYETRNNNFIYETGNRIHMPHMFDETVHKALSSEIRRELLIALSKKDKYLSELAQEAGKKPQTIDFHLSLLEDLGIIDSAWKEGKKYFSLKDKRLLSFLRDRKPLPPGLHPVPPHELILKAIGKLDKKIGELDKKIDQLNRKER